MSLFNYFSSLINYVSEQKEQGFVTTNYSSFKDEVSQRIGTLDLAAAAIDQQQLGLAKFAVYCWIDEIVQRSTWSEKSQWQQQLLQEQYFNTSNGGDIFFENIENLTGQDGDVIRVYYRCLALGFRGKFYRADDQDKLEHVKQHCLALLGLIDKEGHTSVQLCNELYACLENDADASAKGAINKWYQTRVFKWLWPLGVLLIVFLFCFGVLYLTVHNYLNVLS